MDHYGVGYVSQGRGRWYAAPWFAAFMFFELFLLMRAPDSHSSESIDSDMEIDRTSALPPPCEFGCKVWRLAPDPTSGQERTTLNGSEACCSAIDANFGVANSEKAWARPRHFTWFSPSTAKNWVREDVDQNWNRFYQFLAAPGGSCQCGVTWDWTHDRDAATVIVSVHYAETTPLSLPRRVGQYPVWLSMEPGGEWSARYGHAVVATFRQRHPLSHVPVTYAPYEYDIRVLRKDLPPPLRLDENENADGKSKQFLASSIVSNCGRDRDVFLQALSDHGLNIAHFGRCRPTPLNTSVTPRDDVDDVSRVKTYCDTRLKDRDIGAQERKACYQQHFRFHLAFENTLNVYDYVTEKFFLTLQTDTILVYWGAPNVDAFAPGENTYIDASLYAKNDTMGLVRYLQHVAQSPELIAQYTQWRQRPLRPSWDNIWTHGYRNFFCRVSEYIASTLVAFR